MDDIAAVFEQARHEHPLGVPVHLPWEAGFWQNFFEPQDPQKNPLDNFKVASIPALLGVSSETEQPSKRVRTSASLRQSWHSIVRADVELTWIDKREADFQVSLKRWLDVLLSLPDDLSIVFQLREMASVSDQLRMLRDIFHKKAPQTLLKRVRSFLRFVDHCKTSGLIFPGSGLDLYNFMQEFRNNGHPTSRLQGVMQALNFVQHVLGVEELAEHTTSRRCLGASGAKNGGPRKQASPFAVADLEVLREILSDESNETWDRMLAGMVLCAIYTRSRWTDLQQAESLYCDYDGFGEMAYLEFRINEHKCKWSSAFRNSFMPATCPAVGVTSDNWAAVWITVRNELGVDYGRGFPTMPAPTADGKPSSRPLSTEEMKHWTRMLLTKNGRGLGERNITSHSCKCTLLSWLAKHGEAWEDRQVLGGHVSFLKSAITYSRDSMARPLRILENLLYNVRTGFFRPDETRSGRFSQLPVECNDPDSDLQQALFGCDVESMGWEFPDETTQDEQHEEFEAVARPETILVSDDEDIPIKDEDDDQDDSGSSQHETSSSSDEEAAALSGARRVLPSPNIPACLKLIQHRKLRTLHCMERSHQHILLCGRRAVPERYGQVDEVRFDTPLCHMCWRKKLSYET